MSENFDINNITPQQLAAMASGCRITGMTPEQYLMLNKAIADGEGMTPAFQTDIFDAEKAIREASPEKLEQVMEAVSNFAKKALGMAGEAVEKIQVHGDFEGKTVNLEKVVPMGFTCPCDDDALIGRGLKEPQIFFLPVEEFAFRGNNFKGSTRTKVDVEITMFVHKGKRKRGIGHRNRKVKTFSKFTTAQGEVL